MTWGMLAFYWCYAMFFFVLGWMLAKGTGR